MQRCLKNKTTHVDSPEITTNPKYCTHPWTCTQQDACSAAPTHGLAHNRTSVLLHPPMDLHTTGRVFCCTHPWTCTQQDACSAAPTHGLAHNRTCVLLHPPMDLHTTGRVFCCTISSTHCLNNLVVRHPPPLPEIRSSIPACAMGIFLGRVIPVT